MVDKWIAVRLLCKTSAFAGTESGKKLVTLHSATTDKRKTSR